MVRIKRMEFIIPAVKTDQARLALVKGDIELCREDDLYTVLDWYDFRDARTGRGDLLLYECSNHYGTMRDSLVALAPFAKDGSHVWIMYRDEDENDVHELMHVKDGQLYYKMVTAEDVFAQMMKGVKAE